jgi:hypothetical protein
MPFLEKARGLLQGSEWHCAICSRAAATTGGVGFCVSVVCSVRVWMWERMCLWVWRVVCGQDVGEAVAVGMSSHRGYGVHDLGDGDQLVVLETPLHDPGVQEVPQSHGVASVQGCANFCGGNVRQLGAHDKVPGAQGRMVNKMDDDVSDGGGAGFARKSGRWGAGMRSEWGVGCGDTHPLSSGSPISAMPFNTCTATRDTSV